MKLGGKSIAIFIEDIFEDLEFWYPYYRMLEEGGHVTVIGTGKSTYLGKNGLTAQEHTVIDNVNANHYDALIIPGGYSPDKMRRVKKMVNFVRDIHAAGKLVAAICHGPWMLASAEIISGIRVTGSPGIKDDLVHAGGIWFDSEVVVDKKIITSRKPDDLPAFCREIIAGLAE